MPHRHRRLLRLLAAAALAAACSQDAPAPSAPEAAAPVTTAPPLTSVPLPDAPPGNFSVRLQAGSLQGNASESEFIRVTREPDGTMVYRRGRVTIAANPADNRRVVERETPLSAVQVAALYDAVRRSGLFDLEDTYLNANAVDARSPIVRVVAGEYEKTVRASANTAEVVDRIRAALDAI